VAQGEWHIGTSDVLLMALTLARDRDKVIRNVAQLIFGMSLVALDFYPEPFNPLPEQNAAVNQFLHRVRVSLDAATNQLASGIEREYYELTGDSRRFAWALLSAASRCGAERLFVAIGAELALSWVLAHSPDTESFLKEAADASRSISEHHDSDTDERCSLASKCSTRDTTRFNRLCSQLLQKIEPGPLYVPIFQATGDCVRLCELEPRREDGVEQRILHDKHSGVLLKTPTFDESIASDITGDGANGCEDEEDEIKREKQHRVEAYNALSLKDPDSALDILVAQEVYFNLLKRVVTSPAVDLINHAYQDYIKLNFMSPSESTPTTTAMAGIPIATGEGGMPPPYPTSSEDITHVIDPIDESRPGQKEVNQLVSKTLHDFAVLVFRSLALKTWDRPSALELQYAELLSNAHSLITSQDLSNPSTELCQAFFLVSREETKNYRLRDSPYSSRNVIHCISQPGFTSHLRRLCGDLAEEIETIVERIYFVDHDSMVDTIDDLQSHVFPTAEERRTLMSRYDTLLRNVLAKRDYAFASGIRAVQIPCSRHGKVSYSNWTVSSPQTMVALLQNAIVPLCKPQSGEATASVEQLTPSQTTSELDEPVRSPSSASSMSTPSVSSHTSSTERQAAPTPLPLPSAVVLECPRADHALTLKRNADLLRIARKNNITLLFAPQDTCVFSSHFKHALKLREKNHIPVSVPLREFVYDQASIIWSLKQSPKKPSDKASAPMDTRRALRIHAVSQLSTLQCSQIVAFWRELIKKYF